MTASTEDERALIEAAQADPARFVEVYDRYVDRVYAYVSRRAGSRAAAEDITSEVFRRALAHLPRFEWRGVPFAAWLYRIAANAVADDWRRQGRESQEPPPDLPDERVHEELQRRVIEMRFVEDKSVRDVAVALDRSEGAVKQLQLRALENLRKGMGVNG